MNTIAKLSASIAGMADRDAVDTPPSRGVGSDGWAENLLRRAGLPVSRPRRLVLDALRGRDRPVTAQELHWELKLDSRAASTRHHAAGLSTVYRILAILAERNLVHCFHRDGQTAYRLCAASRHDHLLCRCCGRVQEHAGDHTPEWFTQLVTEEGFTADDYRTEVVGLCATCRPDPAAQPHLAACPAADEHQQRPRHGGDVIQ
jgi:Fur family transcriptional regulator, ferric uptake regulator